MTPAEFTSSQATKKDSQSVLGCSASPKNRIAIVSPGKTMGGVRTTVSKLIKGLQLEGFYVSVIPLQRTNLLAKFYSDIANIKELRSFDAIIYMGSIPWPSHIFMSDATLVALFVHGFVRQELINAIKQGSYRVGLGATLLLSLWNAFKLMGKIDLFICRCYTSSEANGICENYVLLPEFVFPYEIELYDEISKSFEQDRVQRNKVKVLTYTSYADSPRLLGKPHIMSLMKNVSRNIKKEVELTIVDPERKNGSIERVGNLTIRHVGFMPKEIFLKELLSSDMFMELCVDEELRNVSIDAGLIGTPIAKLTYGRFVERQDYTEDCLIQAKTHKELIHKVADYLNNVEHYKPIYSRNMRDFILKHRTWNAVKNPLISYLRDSVL